MKRYNNHNGDKKVKLWVVKISVLRKALCEYGLESAWRWYKISYAVRVARVYVSDSTGAL